MTVDINLSHQFCANCGCGMYMPREVVKTLQENRNTFYCMNGHPQSYSKSTADILRETVNAKEKEIQDIKCRLNEAKAEIWELNHSVKRRAKRIS